MLTAFKKGLSIGFSQWRIAFIVYIFQLLLAVMLGVQVYHVLEASIGNSLELDKLLDNYDHTVIMDLFRVHGASISPLFGQLRWLAVIYLVFSVFIHAGMLNAVIREERSWLVFWVGGATYFFRFFKLSLFYLTLFAVVSAVIWLPFLGFFMTSPEVFSSEKISVWLLLLVLVFYLFFLFFLVSWSLIARVKIIREGSRIWPAIRQSLPWMLRHYFPMTGLALLFFLMHVLVFFLYWNLNDTGVVSLVWVLSLLVLQQVVAFFRVMIRVMSFGGIQSYYSNQTEAAAVPAADTGAG